MGHPADASGPRVERFREYLCLLARAHLSPRHSPKIEASDVVQQTLLEAHEQREQFRGRSDAELAGWLKQMLVHNLADALRGGLREKRDVRRERSLEAAIEDSISRAEDGLAANDTSPSQQAIKMEQLLRLADGLAQLPDDQREAVVLHHLQGWPLAQLAEQLQRSEPAVAGLLHRGLKKLREVMEERE
ncbi:MAG: sigma-70 family RNA polymerase sigma factor [Planctomycetales bacterium]|nr:sigma-70 family RNA polymerase sigma factor [Planctomycetales bacterium]